MQKCQYKSQQHTRDTTRSNSTRRDIVDVMNLSHRLGLRVMRFTVHEMLSSSRSTNEGDIDLRKKSVPKNVGKKNERLTPMSLGLRKMDESEYSSFQSL